MKAPRTTHPARRQNFTLLLNQAEYELLSQLAADLGISKGATLRCAIRNVFHTTSTGHMTPSPELDTFWAMFRKGGPI